MDSLNSADFSRAAVEEIIRSLATVYDSFIRRYERSELSELTFFRCWCLDVLRQEGPLTMTEAADRFSISKQQMTRFADEMEARGLVEKRFSTGDRRVTYLRITRAGLDALVTQLNVVSSGQLEQLRDLSPEEASQLLECMTRFRELIDKYWGCGERKPL